MYDMYPWDKAPKASTTPATPSTATASKPSADPVGSAARAVQVALDRRDNGGYAAVAAGAAGQTAAGQTAASQTAASQTTAGPARQ